MARKIASGLRDYYSLDQMQGRRVLVIANLKPRKLQGFESNGMVVCAVAADGKSEFIEPPEGAAPGERVYCEGVTGDAWEPNKVGKRDKKLKTTPLERAQKEMLTSAACVAEWQGKPILTKAGPCTCASLAGVPIK